MDSIEFLEIFKKQKQLQEKQYIKQKKKKMCYVAQSCPTLCNTFGILQANILER